MRVSPVDVWTYSLTVEREAVLTGEERARAARFVFEKDREHWARARSGLRTILASYVGRRPEEIAFSFGEHGKPGVEGVEFNLAHAGGWAMVAVSGGVPVGVDLETIRENVGIAELLRRIGETDLPESRVALFHRWTRREAKTKALGAPLMAVPAGEFGVVDLDAPQGFAASLALVGAMPVARYCGPV